jgi:small subunit ribosomal protein S6
MAKYEIMLVVDGTLDVTSAKSSIKELTDLIDKSQDYKETNLGLKTLAYKINKLDKGHYFLYNFESEVPATIAEFRRLALINKNVLRHLIINQEKDYG